jgi:hypothetical protein
MTFVVMGILQPLPDYHSTSPVSWYELPSNTIAYVYTKLPAVLFPLERIIAVTTTDRPTDRHRIRAQPSTRMYECTIGNLLRVVLEGVGKRER